MSDYSILTRFSPMFEPTLGEAPCQCCGKMVMVWLPHYGCIYCEKCRNRPPLYYFAPDIDAKGESDEVQSS